MWREDKISKWGWAHTPPCTPRTRGKESTTAFKEVQGNLRTQRMTNFKRRLGGSPRTGKNAALNKTPGKREREEQCRSGDDHKEKMENHDASSLPEQTKERKVSLTGPLREKN